METQILWKSAARQWSIFLLALASFYQQGHAQCAAAPIAASACSGGNGAAFDGVTINTGNTYYVATAGAFANVYLNGGTLHICSSLAVSVFTYNSGTLIIENGGSLSTTIANSGDLNGNVVIINRGTLSISGNLVFQNSNNAFYNDLSTSIFSLSGNLTVNSSTTTIVNRGKFSIGGTLLYEGATGGFCVGPESLTTIPKLNNVTANSFSYPGTGAPACVNVTTSATLTDPLTTSSLIHVCEGGTVVPTGPGGWGSATVTTNCSSCATVLSLGIDNFTAVRQGSGVQLHWTAGVDPGDNIVFYGERSTDGSLFQPWGVVSAMAGESDYVLTDPDATAPKLYYRVRAVNAMGGTSYSTIALVENAASGQLQLFPNPAGPNTAVTMLIPASATCAARISLINMAGQVLNTRVTTLTAGSNTVSWSLAELAAGIYLMRIELAGGNLYGRLVVRP